MNAGVGIVAPSAAFGLGQEFFLQASLSYLQAAGVPVFQNLQDLQLFEFPLIVSSP